MGFLTSIVPLQYRLLVYALAALALFAAGWVKGNDHGSKKLSDYIGKQAVEAVRIITARAKVTERIVNHYIKVEEDTKSATEEIAKEVAKYAEKNRTFVLDPKWRSLHDRAALNAVSRTPGQADDPGGTAPSAAEAIATVTENYGACNRTADRLDGLQEWIMEQRKVR